MKGVEFPKYGFGEFILGSEERRKDKEPCGSMILMEERDRKSEEAKKDRQKEREKYTSEKENVSEAGSFIPQEVFTILSLTAFSEWQNANYFLQQSASLDSFGRPALASIFFTVVILNGSPANTPPGRRWRLCV